MFICGAGGENISFTTAQLLEGSSFDADDLSLREESQPELVRVISAVTALAVDSGCGGASVIELVLANESYCVLHAVIKQRPIFFAVSTRQGKQIEQCATMFLVHVHYLASTFLENQYGILLEKLDEKLRREMVGSTFKETMGRTPRKVQRITEEFFEDEGNGIDQVHIHEELAEFEVMFILRLEREYQELYRAFAFEPLHAIGGGGEHPFFLCSTSAVVKGKRDVSCLYQGGKTAFSPFHKEIVQGYCDTTRATGKTRLLLTGAGAGEQCCVLASLGPLVVMMYLSPSACGKIAAPPLCSVSEYRAWGASVLPLWVASRWFETLRRLRCLFPSFTPDDLDPSLPGTPSVKAVAEGIFDPVKRMQGALEPVSEGQEGGDASRAYEELYAPWDGYMQGEEEASEVQEQDELQEGPRPASPVESMAVAGMEEPVTPQSGPASFQGITPQPPKGAKTPTSKTGGARFFRLFSASSDP